MFSFFWVWNILLCHRRNFQYLFLKLNSRRQNCMNQINFVLDYEFHTVSPRYKSLKVRIQYRDINRGFQMYFKCVTLWWFIFDWNRSQRISRIYNLQLWMHIVEYLNFEIRKSLQVTKEERFNTIEKYEHIRCDIFDTTKRKILQVWI